MNMWMWILIGLDFITKVHGYPNSPFPDSCVTMSPIHKSRTGQLIPPQTKIPPYEVSYAEGREGEPIIVSLRGSTSFRGFMLEARQTDAANDMGPVGKFILLPSYGARLMACSRLEGSAVSHINEARKTLIQVNWTAQGEELNITFRATFVQSYSTFWEGVEVNVITPTPPSTTTSTEPSTTTSTQRPSTATSTQPSTTTSTEPSATTSTQRPSTATSTQPSTTTSTQPSTTTNTEPSTTTSSQKPNATLPEEGVPVLMSIDSYTDILKVGLLNIATNLNGHFSLSLCKGLMILCSVVCAAVEIIAVVWFYLEDSSEVTLVALVYVVIAVNFVELVIVTLPLGPSHELKEICHLAVRMCSVIHEIFAIAVIFLGVLEIDNCRQNRRESWLLKVMIAYSAWIFLFAVWVFIFSTHIKIILRRSKIVSSKRREQKRQQRQKLSAAEKIVVAASVIIIVGAWTFTIAIIVGIFRCQEK
ncbi:uncharacterized protein LOC121183561 isoform X2 [Toxotes jaculatrix]|uniref:uncharacterized protein LOC121183561 isoform X2 n=1 Tax=Toxotes jaculatrix TaxID=941984 RepID=UPI001B3A7BC1|nr:uncharacterized protein LOC121183561 isoform X2 [Toxotes jaculatrix]